ncbi:STAS domain-containing protein [Clostridium sp. WILCCON 0269]|uniref:STAS domain-containing protein n=1 Tax=Candidatus Clostridium eludens TaxID=3381663 RepID=A0ABW8SLY3_9CLOT
MNHQTNVKFELVKEKDVLYDLWLKELNTNKTIGDDSPEETKKLTGNLFNAFIKILQSSLAINMEAREFEDVKAVFQLFSKTMALKGQSPTTTARYIFSLKSVVSRFLQSNYSFSTENFNEEIIKIHEMVDTMGLYTFEYFVKEREKIIQIQKEDMLELSTPVIKIWEGILTLPLIGTLDSKRTQIVMEKLLDAIIATSSKVAILDITGVPTVDTYVANHLINTAAAAKLLGTEIIITGISPTIAQIIVHLGIDLSGLITRSLMEDGFRLALEMCNYKVQKFKIHN